MSMIGTWNTNISDAVNKEGELYKAWIGQDPFTPESTITVSSDFNCGAICNELEFVRAVSNYYVQSLAVDEAEEEELEDLITTFIDLPRRGSTESEATYRLRYKFIVVEKTNPSRTTRWALLDAISYFIADPDTIQIIEIFDVENLFFEVRIEGASTYEDIIFINNTEQAYIDQNFVGGPSIGEVISYLGELLNRIKAAGVDFDILFVDQSSTTKTSDCTIGSVQVYKTSDARIRGSLSTTKLSDATIV